MVMPGIQAHTIGGIFHMRRIQIVMARLDPA
jgi:hypothetical protein